MIKKALIFGAGAIGRGFLAPLLFENNYQISFVDKNKNLIKKLKKKISIPLLKQELKIIILKKLK